MANRKSETEKKSSKRHQSVLGIIMRGQLIDSGFFRRYWLGTVLLVILSLAYITNKYSCQTKMEEERRLTEELEVVRTERIRMRSYYMGRIRESSMQQLADSLHLGLSVRENPPYKLTPLK